MSVIITLKEKYGKNKALVWSMTRKLYECSTTFSHNILMRWVQLDNPDTHNIAMP